jgi:hypothetical protein
MRASRLSGFKSDRAVRASVIEGLEAVKRKSENF